MATLKQVTKTSSQPQLSPHKLNKSQNTLSSTMYDKRFDQLSNGPAIEVLPQEIIFKDIQINQTYEITVFVRNLTKTARRIRVFQPHTSKFRADYDMQGAIAAGLAMKLIITFETSVLEEFHDSIKIVSDGGFSIDVPLHAYPPQAGIIFEPFINLGFVRVGKEKQEQIFFKNEGKTNGKVELKYENLTDFKIEPTSFTIQQGQEYAVNLTYKPKEAGIFRGIIEVIADGNQLQKTIDINATSIEFSRFLIDENGTQTVQFDFGLTYYGQAKEIQTYLINNSPKQQKFKVSIKQGYHYSTEDMGKLQTPNELGQEQTERIMDCFPSEGMIDSYSQMAIKFRCRSKVNEKQQIWTRQYSMNNEDIKADQDDYHYSAIFEFQQDSKDLLIVHLQAKCICPTIKFPPTPTLQFGQCQANKEKQMLFQVTNKNSELPIDINFPIIPYFCVSPAVSSLEPEQASGISIFKIIIIVAFWITFKPKHTGSFQTIINVELLNGIYKIPLKLLGQSTSFGPKVVQKRGPESLPQDFEKQRKDMAQIDTLQSKKEQHSMEKLLQSSLDVSQSAKSLLVQHGISVEKIEEIKIKSINKEIYNEYLKLRRVKRLQKDKEKMVKSKFLQMNQRLKEMGLTQNNINIEKQSITDKKLGANSNHQSDDDETARGPPPVDYEFEVGMIEYGLNEPQMGLPEAKDTLYVTKPIDKYEPIKAEKQIDGKLKKFEPDPNQQIRKKFPHEPKTHSEIRDTLIELTPEMLQRIQAGPVRIDFGSVYVKSKMSKTFFVKNDLRTSISVRLYTDREELSLSYLKPQIIPSGQQAGFDVIICSKVLGAVKQNVKYIINEKHIFEFLVTSNIDPVQLELSKQSLKFSFAEDNIEMETSEIIRITNNGNAGGKFKWILTEKQIFTAFPDEGEVPAYSNLDIKIVYKPTQSSSQKEVAQQQQQAQAINRNEEEKLTMKVYDGIEQNLKCFGMVNEPKCTLRQASIDMKDVCVSKQEQKPLTIKNLSRSSAVFRVDHTPEFVEVVPPKGKILGEEQKDLQVKFLAKEEVTVKGDIVILIRGGRVLRIPFSARTIIPEVVILEEEFNFGNITTLGNSTILQMTVVNKSQISAELVLDMRGDNENPTAPDGIECLDVKTAEDADDSLLHSVHPEQDSEDQPEQKQDKKRLDEVDIEAMEDQSEEGSEPVDLEVKERKLFTMVLTPEKQVQFNLRFSPKEVKQYSFNVPLTLSRYGPLPTLTRQVLCRGLKPKFLIEPQNLEFKKKVISTPDKCYPTIQDIILSNPDRRDVQWRIDINPLKIDKVFEIEPYEGVVQSGQQQQVHVKFNPFGPGSYTNVVSLYILSDPEIPAKLPYVELSFSGSGAYPRLLFDKKEVILPVVPLNIPARCYFKIINDGYENLNLTYKWAQELNFQIDLRFPDGKNLGITRNKVRVEVIFQNKKPLSFTAKLEFVDESRTYPLIISGTTDNCLFTNFPYLQRTLGEFKITMDDHKPILIEEEDDECDSVKSKKTKKQPTTSVKSTSSKSTTALGYKPLTSEQLNESCDAIKRWMNYNVLTQQIQQYPESVIEHSGLEMFELLTFLTGKVNYPYKANLDQNVKKFDRVSLVYKQFDEMIRIIKIDGGFLNHIRPEYLMNYSDYLAWLKTLSKDKFEFVPENQLRLSMSKYSYISQDAWITLFYQILKVYYLGRISSKMFKQVAGVPPDKIQVPDYYIEGSNMISQSEGVLLWWYEVCYEIVHPLQSRRLTDFSKSFQDCQTIAASLQAYIGQSVAKIFANMRVSCQNEDDYRSNSEKVLSALSEVGLQSHINLADLYKPSQRELLLFLIQLFYALPHYIPKREPIVFSCILGEELIKSIDLLNPTAKPISYWAKYEGHPDFSLEGDDSFKIEPKQTYKYKIKFTSRISQPVQGRVIFTNKKETNVQAAALVFDLISQITGRKSEVQWQPKAFLYEPFDFNITVTNKFTTTDSGEFQIQIVHEKKIKEQGKTKKNQQQQIKQPTAAKIDSEPQIISEEEEFPSFFCRVDKIRIKKGTNQQLSITFLPLTLDQHKCSIIFSDPQVGEFQHEIVGTVELPKVMDDLKPEKPLYVDTPVTLPFDIPFKNEQMIKARKTVENFIMEKNRDRYMKGDKNANLNVGGKINFPGLIQSDQLSLECELLPATQYVSVPTTITLTRKGTKTNEKQTDKKKPKQQNSESGVAGETEGGPGVSSKLPITYSFKNPVRDFNVLLTMRNTSKTDIRRYKLWATVLPKVIKAVLEFRVPARQQIIQEIPLQNNTEREWGIRIQLHTDGYKNGNLFSIVGNLKEVQVKRKGQGVVPVQFAPYWVQESDAKLILTNPSTSDVFEYELKGYGEEPIAEEHIILNCQARKQTRREIELKNPHPDKIINYKVETDLINAAGANTITIQPGKKASYILNVTPVLSGQYTGSITFTDDDGRYFWYTVFMNTEAPKSSQTVDLTTTIRQATIFSVTLKNPLQQPVVYEVMINGDGLHGENQLIVAANESGKYDLIFAPLKVGKWRGSVAFVNQSLGEAWYELNLQSDEQPPIRMNVMKASLGKVEEQIVFLENPSDQQVPINIRISNPTNFDVNPDQISIAPYDQIQIALRYMPSSLETIEQADIIFSSPIIGKWHYLVFGQGLPPTKFPTTTVSIGLNKDYSSVIHFKNPFKEPIQVNVSLEAEGHNADVFKLLLLNRKKKDGESEKILVPGMNVMQVPFSFVPREITCYYCEIIVSMNEKIQWRFPVKGVTESVSNQTLFHFKAKCREKWEDEIKVGLTGIVQILGADDKFDYELANIPYEFQSMIQKCFQIKTLKNFIEHPQDTLQYFIRFTPMKPMKTTIDFIVLRQSGGRWKFKIQLEASEPEEDDVIIISSPLNKTTSVSFKLTNKVKSYAKFSAGFSPESDPEFSVMPKQGDLEPYGREGTTFIISFTPVEYGKIRKGKLIIQTEDMFWSYIIKGILPRYLPPKALESAIDHKLEQRYVEQISQIVPKNFLVENIKRSKNSPKGGRSSPKGARSTMFPSINESKRQ